MTDPVSLDGRRPPVRYTVRLEQWQDGRMTVFVEDVGDHPENRRRIAVALREAADMMDSSAPNEVGRLREVLWQIAEGATGYADRDAELAAWAREALGD